MDRRDYAGDDFGRWRRWWIEDEGNSNPPTVREVCPTCDGRGRYVNPSIDSNGISADEWAEWGDDEQEMYLTGQYDVICGECRGNNVVERLAIYASDEMKASWNEWTTEAHDYRLERMAEMRMGC